MAAGVAGIEGAELTEIRWKPCVLVWRLSCGMEVFGDKGSACT